MGRLSLEEDFPDIGAPLLASVPARIEAAIFAADRPLLERELAALLPNGVDIYVVLTDLKAFWDGRGIQLVRENEGWVMRSRVDLLPPEEVSPVRRLSPAANATLMTIAMHQPITMQQIEQVRGVRLQKGILEGLEASGLIRTVGRRRGTGRAVVWETTERFLDVTGLDQLADLPTPEEAFMLDLDQPIREPAS